MIRALSTSFLIALKSGREVRGFGVHVPGKAWNVASTLLYDPLQLNPHGLQSAMKRCYCSSHSLLSDSPGESRLTASI